MGMNSETKRSIPLPTIRRFPVYLRLLKEQLMLGKTWISATTLAYELRLKPIQVRKDMACTGVTGKPKIGFLIEDLINAIEAHLGWDNSSDAVLIGAGHLGNALAGYRGFDNYGLKVAAVFDSDPKKIGTAIGELTVLSMDTLEDYIAEHGILVGILTVPDSYAQEIAERLVASGIIGIWNFAPINLKLPEQIIVQRTDLATAFAELSSRLNSSIDN